MTPATDQKRQELLAFIERVLKPDPAFEWPEGRRAEMKNGWLAFDRHEQVARLIAQRTIYPDQLRQERLDDGLYSAAPIDQAFIRAHEEQGYELNMADWKAENLARMLAIGAQD